MKNGLRPHFSIMLEWTCPLPSEVESMPRPTRVVIPGLPHHVTHRGNRCSDIFRETEDREIYLRLLQKHANQDGVSVCAYTLMTNHVHLIVIPERDESLSDMIQNVHGAYAQYSMVNTDLRVTYGKAFFFVRAGYSSSVERGPVCRGESGKSRACPKSPTLPLVKCGLALWNAHRPAAF